MVKQKNKVLISKYIKEIVFGGIDGIVTTFAIVAGFTGATVLNNDISIELPIIVVLVFGFSNLLADGFSMGIGEFLSTRSEKKMYKKEFDLTKARILKNPANEKVISIGTFKKEGFSTEDAMKLVSIYKKNVLSWTEFKMRYELNMYLPDDSPMKNSMATFFSFISFGFLPLFPYILNLSKPFYFSVIFSIVAFCLLGFMRSEVTEEGVFIGIFEITILGIVAGFIAFLVGSFIG